MKALWPILSLSLYEELLLKAVVFLYRFTKYPGSSKKNFKFTNDYVFSQKEYEETMLEDRRKVAQEVYDRYLKDDVSLLWFIHKLVSTTLAGHCIYTSMLWWTFLHLFNFTRCELRDFLLL